MTNPAGFTDFILSAANLYKPNPAIPINTGSPDVSGSYWWYKTLKGWASPDARVTMLPLISQEGEIPADLHYRGRSIQMTGWVESPTEAARELARYTLTGALDVLNTDFPGLFQVREIDHARNVSFVHSGNNNSGLASFDENNRGIRAAAELVQYSGFRQVADAAVTLGSNTLTSATANFTSADLNQVIWDTLGYLPVGSVIIAINSPTSVTFTGPFIGGAFGTATGLPIGIGASGGLPNGEMAYLADWEFEIYAPDPRKYGSVNHTTSFSAGSASVPNLGNTPSPSLGMEITTAGQNPITISGPGFSMLLQANGVFTMPAQVGIDFAARTITDGNGVNRYDLLQPGLQWGELHPGPNTLHTSPACAGDIGWRDAWI